VDWKSHKIECIGRDSSGVEVAPRIVPEPPTAFKQKPQVTPKSSTRDNAEDVLYESVARCSAKLTNLTKQLENLPPGTNWEMLQNEHRIASEAHQESLRMLNSILLGYGATPKQITYVRKHIFNAYNWTRDMYVAMLENNQVRADTADKIYAEQQKAWQMMERICGKVVGNPKKRHENESRLFDNLTTEVMKDAADGYVDALEELRNVPKPAENIEGFFSEAFQYLKTGGHTLLQGHIRDVLNCTGWGDLKSIYVRASNEELQEEYEDVKKIINDAARKGKGTAEFALRLAEILEESERAVHEIYQSTAEDEIGPRLERQIWSVKALAHGVFSVLFGGYLFHGVYSWNTTQAERNEQLQNATTKVLEILPQVINKAQHLDTLRTQDDDLHQQFMNKANDLVQFHRIGNMITSPSMTDKVWQHALKQHASTQPDGKPLLSAEIVARFEMANATDLMDTSKDVGQGVDSVGYFNGTHVTIDDQTTALDLSKEISAAQARSMATLFFDTAKKITEQVREKYLKDVNPDYRSVIRKGDTEKWRTLEEGMTVIFERHLTAAESNEGQINAVLSDLANAIHGGESSIPLAIIQEWAETTRPQIENAMTKLQEIQFQTAKLATEISRAHKEKVMLEKASLNAIDSRKMLEKIIEHEKKRPAGIVSQITHIPSDLLYTFRMLRDSWNAGEITWPACDRFRGWYYPVMESSAREQMDIIAQVRKAFPDNSWTDVFHGIAKAAALQISMSYVFNFGFSFLETLGLVAIGSAFYMVNKAYTQALHARKRKEMQKAPAYMNLSEANAIKNAAARKISTVPMQLLEGLHGSLGLVAKTFNLITLVSYGIAALYDVFNTPLFSSTSWLNAFIVGWMPGAAWAQALYTGANCFLQLYMGYTFVQLTFPNNLVGQLSCDNKLAMLLATGVSWRLGVPFHTSYTEISLIHWVFSFLNAIPYANRLTAKIGHLLGSVTWRGAKYVIGRPKIRTREEYEQEIYEKVERQKKKKEEEENQRKKVVADTFPSRKRATKKNSKQPEEDVPVSSRTSSRSRQKSTSGTTSRPLRSRRPTQVPLLYGK
jgi:hypothetical protein